MYELVIDARCILTELVIQNYTVITVTSTNRPFFSNTNSPLKIMLYALCKTCFYYVPCLKKKIMTRFFAYAI